MFAASFEYVYGNAINNGINANFATNGMFLTEQWIRRFLHDDIQIQVSLDGARAQTVQRIRKGSNFDKIVNSLRLFRDLKKKEYAGSKASVAIHFVALRSNVEELPDLILLAKDLGISHVIVLEFCVTIQSFAVRRESLRYHKQLANKYYALAGKRARESGISLEIHPYDSARNKISGQTCRPEKNGFRFPQKCFAPWNRILIRSNGDITPCCASAEIMGNIKNGFWKVWNGPRYKKFRSRINTNMPPLDCRNCVQTFGVNAGNPENIQQYEGPKHKIIYFFEHKYKYIKYIYHYLADYLN